MSHKFPLYHQHDVMDCEATCLRMIAKYYGKNCSLETLREKTYITREGVTLLGISEAAEKIGFRTSIHCNFEKLNIDAPLRCIVYWRPNHYSLWLRTLRRCADFIPKSFQKPYKNLPEK